MAGNYFKAAWKNIFRRKVFSLLNVTGLAISLTAFILMALYIEEELSFDKFYKNANNIYRVVDDKQTPGVLLRSAQTAAPVAPALLMEIPEIKQAVRLMPAESLVKYNDKLFEERSLLFADKGAIELFGFTMLEGNARSALKEPQTVVLTLATAKKYFGSTDALGKVLVIGEKAMKVTGVINNVPGNSHFTFDFLISMATVEEKNSGYDWLFTNWYSNRLYTYIELPEKNNLADVAAQMPSFDARHKEARGNTIHRYTFEKLTGIYLHSDRANQIGRTGSLTNLYIFSAVALFLLLIACVNFINLSTAQSLLRAKEVAIKKVTGATRGQVIGQFLAESFLTSGIALAAAVTTAYLLLPAFNTFSGKLLSLHLFSPLHLLALLLLFLLIGLLSGTYPAVVLSGFAPVAALKGNVNTSVRNIALRKALVVFQFSFSILLIICSLTVNTQMRYLQRHELGFNQSQTMVINFEGDDNVRQRLGAVKQQLLAIPGVEKVTASSNVPGDGNAGNWSMNFAKAPGDTIHTELPIYLTDYTFLNQFGIKMSSGRSFSEEYAVDSMESMLVNETALKQLGFTSAAEAIGVTVGMYPADAKIIGVIKDFHFESLQNPVTPLAMRILPSNFRLLSLKINVKSIQQTVAAIEAKWKTIVPERPLEYSFLDESFNKQYQSQIKFGKVFNAFTILAVVIACLGLFGLALFNVNQRTKEIGVRKVLGASAAGIVVTLSKDFIRLVVVSILVASPVGYYFMRTWLNDFAYRIGMSLWIFLAAGAGAILIALMTISYQVTKAARANPVKSLRTE